MSGCPGPDANLGVIRSVLGTVDCHVQVYSQAGYLALTGPQSFFPAALTTLMTLYVALLGLRLMFGLGSARLVDAPVMALKIGVILTLTLNWSVFQTLVFDMTSKGPIEIARIVAAPARGSGSDLAADPLAGLQTAYDQLGVDAAAFGKLAGPNPQVLRGGEASAADDLWRARSALFMSTAGIMAIAAVAVGVLAAIGPVFIALFLFQETRGLFAGWLRALLAASLTSMVCWITTAVLLVVIDPWLLELARTRDAGAPDLQTASVLSSVVFVFAAAQAALTMGAGLIASGFQLNFSRPPRPGAPSPALRAAPAERLSRAERLVLQLQHSASSQRLSFASAVAGPTLGAGLRGGQAVAGFDGRSGGVRLGDGYRRDAHFDRFRKRDRST